MHKLEGAPQHYAWGSMDAIPAILGIPRGEEPLAEYWLGAHHKAPSTVAGRPLHDVVGDAPHTLGAACTEAFGDRLPYLLKLLAAEAPLSLQAHPTRAQAEEGFAREEAAGIPLSAPERTYRDDWPKPEALVALTDFDALCGFRDPRETWSLFEQLGPVEGLDSVIGPLHDRSGEAALAEVFLDTLSLEGERRGIVERVVARAVDLAGDPGPVGRFACTAVEIDEHWPGDPGILAALLLNRVTLRPGDAIFLEAGNMHAYLRGTGVEIMANSDNVLRGGLTPKHINVDELVRCVSFAPLPVRLVEQVQAGPHTIRYATPAPEFALYRVDAASQPVPAPGTGARIVLATSGAAELAQGDQVLPLAQGEAAFLDATQTTVSLTCEGQVFVAAPGV